MRFLTRLRNIFQRKNWLTLRWLLRPSIHGIVSTILSALSPGNIDFFNLKISKKSSLFHTNDPGKYVPPTKDIETIKRPFPEGNTSDGSEFMDDAIHMEDAPPDDTEDQ